MSSSSAAAGGRTGCRSSAGRRLPRSGRLRACFFSGAPWRQSMRVWIDLANSPHVATFEPVVARLRRDGAGVVLTVRDHAQTLELARRSFGDVTPVRGESPAGPAAKGLEIVRRAERLRRFALETEPDVALSHGSYAQLLAPPAPRRPRRSHTDSHY